MSLRFNTGAMQYRESPSDNWQPLVIQANMNWASMADIYDPVNGSYEYGEYVLYGGAMYRCISTTGASGAWDSTKWTSVSVGDELASFIIISDTQPTETSNKIWIKESSAQDPVQIPTMAEFSALESDVVDISDDVDAIENTLNQLEDDLDNLCVQSSVITSNSFTNPISCTGLTANHVVCNWGLFSDAQCTTPISPNNPPADITIEEGAGQYNLTIQNSSGTFYLKPTFILP